MQLNNNLWKLYLVFIIYFKKAIHSLQVFTPKVRTTEPKTGVNYLWPPDSDCYAISNDFSSTSFRHSLPFHNKALPINATHLDLNH